MTLGALGASRGLFNHTDTTMNNIGSIPDLTRHRASTPENINMKLSREANTRLKPHNKQSRERSKQPKDVMIDIDKLQRQPP